MTNYEKFVKVFGFKPEKQSAIIKCPDSESETACKYFKFADAKYTSVIGCRCEEW